MIKIFRKNDQKKFFFGWKLNMSMPSREIIRQNIAFIESIADPIEQREKAIEYRKLEKIYGKQ